jgi:hypothetical protein
MIFHTFTILDLLEDLVDWLLKLAFDTSLSEAASGCRIGPLGDWDWDCK